MTNRDVLPTMSDPIVARLQTALGDGYRLERELGGGGMSRVFVAHEAALDRRLVVKVLSEELGGLSRERFRREVLTSATLQHPHIVGVIAAGDADGLAYFIMPFVEGESLRQRLSRDVTLSPANAVAIMRDVARALAFAHERGVVHRDIKPENILISGHSAVVLDFGVAKAIASARTGKSDSGATITSVGVSLGTPAYMAPEQIAGDPNTDLRADIYSLGVTVYEMLTGRLPFAKGSLAETLTAHLVETPALPSQWRPGIPMALEALIMRCLEKDPSRRPQDAAEVLALLDDPAVVSGAISSTSIRQVRRSQARVRGRQAAVGAAIALVALTAGVLWSRMGGRGAVAAPPAAPAAPAAKMTPAVAVLPLVSVSPDSSDNYIALGMADEIINALTGIRGVRVASRSAAAAAQQQGGALSDVAKRLGVSFLLEGTVQRAGKSLRVAVRLVNAADGFSTWSDVFDGSTDDLLTVERDIANSIAQAVRTDVAGDSAAGTPAPLAHTPDPATHNEYLQAHFNLERRGETALRQAIAGYQRAIARDSLYARAWAELAQAWSLLPLHSTVAPSEVWPKAVAAANRALALDSTLAAAHAALGNIANGEWRWREGERELLHAIVLDSGYAVAYQWLGENRLLNGDARAASVLLGTASRLDADAPLPRAIHGLALVLAGSGENGLTELKSAVEMDPSLVASRLMLGSSYLYLGKPKEAARELEAAGPLAPNAPLVLGTLGVAYAASGNHDAATRIARTLESQGAKPGAVGARAKVLIAMGDTARGLSQLEAALRARDPIFSSEPFVSPIFNSVRASPRFAAVLSAAGLDVARLTSGVKP